jgi:hypothetical protein
LQQALQLSERDTGNDESEYNGSDRSPRGPDSRGLGLLGLDCGGLGLSHVQRTL